MRVAFRVDASIAMGTGHVMRCLTLADHLVRKGVHCVFICREHAGHLAEWIRHKGFDCHLLPKPDSLFVPLSDDLAHAAWLGASWQEDAEQTRAFLEAPVDWLVVDHYAIDARWQVQVASVYARLMVIDDLADRPQRADLLLDQTFARRLEDYQSLVPSHCQLLLGSAYALLRPEFAQWRDISLLNRGKSSATHSLLISMGGVDADNMTASVLTVINQLCVSSSLELTVVLGETSPHSHSVQQLAESMRYPTRLLVGVNNMAELMAHADLAIGAAGSTTWERACLGVPSLLFCLADNQRSGVEAVAQQGAAWFLRNPEDLALVLPLLLSMPERLAQMGQFASQLTDGQGVHKVARALLQTRIELQSVTLDDSETLFAWRNHPSIRSVSLQQQELEFEAHHHWLQSSLMNGNRLMWMAYSGDVALGMIRFDRTDVLSQEAEVSLYLAPEQQAKGLGRKLLALGEQAMLSQWTHMTQIRAQVLANNMASMHLFTHAHYQARMHVFYKQVTHEPSHSH